MAGIGIISSTISMILLIFDLIAPGSKLAGLLQGRNTGLFSGSQDRMVEIAEKIGWDKFDTLLFDQILTIVYGLAILVGSIVIFIPERRIGKRKFLIATISGAISVSLIFFGFYLANIYGPNYDLIQRR